MTDHHREIEDKYDVDEGAVLPPFAALPGVTSIDGPEEHQLEATYFDTPRLALAAAGVTLRRRTGGHDQGWHLKLPASGSRHEVRSPLGGEPEKVPEKLRQAVVLFARGEPLVPIARLHTRRIVHRLQGPDRTLAEVSDDRVAAEVIAAGGGPETWREWELELVEGDHDLLAAGGDLLTNAGARPAAGPSKLARALGPLMPERSSRPGPVPDREGPAAAVVVARLGEQVEELRRRDPQVRSDAPDSVHKMRVALRRLRSALATYRPMLDRDVTEPIRDELRWIAGVLGEARDAEVMRERLQDLITEEDEEAVRGAVVRRVDSVLRDEYHQAQTRALAAMESERYFGLHDVLGGLVQESPWSESAQEPVDDILRRRVKHDWKRLRRRAQAAEEATAPDERARRLHEVRKAAKRVRYAAEPLVELYGDEARRFVKAAKRVQSRLGDHHDSVVAHARLTVLADQAAAEGDSSFTFGVLYSREDELAAQAEDAFTKAWQKAKRKKLRRWLG